MGLEKTLLEFRGPYWSRQAESDKRGRERGEEGTAERQRRKIEATEAERQERGKRGARDKGHNRGRRALICTNHALTQLFVDTRSPHSKSRNIWLTMPAITDTSTSTRSG